MYIGQLATLTGCTPKAIRLYESLGLLAEPKRRGRYRVYDAHDADVVRLIRASLSVGFKLSELSGLIAEKHRLQRFPIERANEEIEAKRRQVRARLQELQALDASLDDFQRTLNEMYGPSEAEPGRVTPCPETPNAPRSKVLTSL